MVFWLALGASLIGFGPKNWWICDLVANLRMHLVALLLVLVPVLLHARRPRNAAIAFAAAMVAIAVSITPPAGSRASNEISSFELTIVSYNLGPAATDQAAAARFLSTVQSDIVILQEYSFEWHQHLRALSESYPHFATEPRNGPFGIALLSRAPLTDTVVRNFPDTDIPALFTTAIVDGERIDLLALHLEWPMSPASFSIRNKQIDHVADFVASSDHRLIVCGDFNLTPWSRWYSRLQAAGLHSGSDTGRFIPTWPAQLRWLGIPIDHCLASTSITVRSKSVGPSLGSDHRPIVVTFSGT